MSKRDQYDTVSLDDLRERLGFEPFTSESDDPTFDTVWESMSEDRRSEIASDFGLSSAEMTEFASALLGRGITATHIRSALDHLPLSALIGTAPVTPDEPQYLSRLYVHDDPTTDEQCFCFTCRLEQETDVVTSTTSQSINPSVTTTSQESTMKKSAITAEPEMTEQDIAETEHVYTLDSGLPDTEATLAEQIAENGIEVVAAQIASTTGQSVRDDLARTPVFDPDAYSFIPVLDVFEDEEVEIVQTMCYKTLSGAPNPLYVTQQWLDAEGFERLFVARFPVEEGGEPGTGQPVVIYTQQHEDDTSGFTSNVPIALVKVLTPKAGREFVQQFRPEPTEEEMAARAAVTKSAAAKIRALTNRQF